MAFMKFLLKRRGEAEIQEVFQPCEMLAMLSTAITAMFCEQTLFEGIA